MCVFKAFRAVGNEKINENHLYISPGAPGLLIKFIWAHINHAAKTF